MLGPAYCGECAQCLAGNPAACERTFELNFSGKNGHGVTPIHTEDGQDVSQFFGQSSFSTYTVANFRNVTKVPNDVDLTLLGPLGCGLMTGAGSVLNSLNPESGSSIAVFGTGAVGMAGLMAAKIAGATTIIAVDINDDRLALAKELGATHTINSMKVDAVEEIRNLTDGGMNYTFETTGVTDVTLQALQALQALRALRVKGVMGAVAVGKKDLTLNITNEIVVKAATIMGIVEGDAVPQLFIPKMIEFYKQGMFPFDKLIKKYKFEEAEQAFADSKSGKTIKPVIVMD